MRIVESTLTQTLPLYAGLGPGCYVRGTRKRKLKRDGLLELLRKSASFEIETENQVPFFYQRIIQEVK